MGTIVIGPMIRLETVVEIDTGDGRVLAAPLVIIPFGDSMTSGKAPGSGEGGTFGGGAWRTGCWQRLVTPGNAVTFVGQYTSGDTDALLAATGHHEGLSGVTLETLTATMAARIAAAQAVPTAITLLAGINDIYEGDGAALNARMTAALDELRGAAGMASVPIFAANLIPAAVGNDVAIDPAEVLARSASLSTLISARGDNIFLVDSFAAVPDTNLNAGGIHPNSIGYAKLGRAFARKIFEVMP